MPRYVLLYDEPGRYEEFMLVMDVRDELLTEITKDFPIHAYLDLLTTPNPMPRSPEIIKFYSTVNPRSKSRINPTHVLLSPRSEYKHFEIDDEHGPILKVERDLTEGNISRRELLHSNRLYLKAMHDESAVITKYARYNNGLYHRLRLAFYNIETDMSPAEY